MEYRSVGRTGLEVSKLGFGTMAFGGQADAEASTALFERCREVGINLFDTADVYNQGRSEQLLGQLADRCRDEVVICTKAYFPTGTDRNARGASRFHLARAAEASLTRLGTDRIDIYYIHRFDEATDLEETLRALEHLVCSGKVVYPAVSNFAAWQIAKALGIQARCGWAPLACMQPMYNLLKRQAEVELLPLAASEGVGVFPYSPSAGGLLTGKYGPDRAPAEGRIVDDKLYGVRYGAASNFEIAGRFTELARRFGAHPAALAVAWVGSHPAVTAPLIGARTVEQLDDVLAAESIDVTAELRAEIAALSPPPPPATDRTEESSGVRYGRR